MPFEDTDTEEHLQLYALRKEELLNLITEETKLWSSPSIAIREGDAVTELPAEAAKVSADLIILGATGALKVARLFTTGVIHRVIAETKAPVITLRQEQDLSKIASHQPTSAGREVSASS